jgi:hypothetical protein
VLRTASVALPNTVSGDQTVIDMGINYCTDNCSTDLAFTIENVRGETTATIERNLHPEWTIPLRIGSIAGELLSARDAKPIAFVWQAGEWSYSVQGTGVGLDNLLQVIAGLRIV